MILNISKKTGFALVILYSMENLKRIADIYKTFSDPTRLKIIKLLMDNKYLCVNAITHRLTITQSAVSQHLRVLRQSGLVKSQRMSMNVHYRMDKEALKEFNKQVFTFFGKDFV